MFLCRGIREWCVIVFVWFVKASIFPVRGLFHYEQTSVNRGRDESGTYRCRLARRWRRLPILVAAPLPPPVRPHGPWEWRYACKIYPVSIILNKLVVASTTLSTRDTEYSPLNDERALTSEESSGSNTYSGGVS